MSYLSETIRKLSQKLYTLSKKIEYFHLDSKIVIYRDCFETVDVLIKLFQPQYLCDIGANCGKWAYVLHKTNPSLKHIVFFEPQKKLEQTLNELSLPGVSKVIYSCALGDKEETLTIKGGTSSASFLNSTEVQDFYFPNSVQPDSELVDIKILDKIYEENDLPQPDLIKLDVQGFELNVLRGASNVISKAKCLVIELSFREFYKNQPHVWEVFKFLQEHGYTMIAKGYEWKSYKSGVELLQMDGIFINKRFIDEFDNIAKINWE